MKKSGILCVLLLAGSLLGGALFAVNLQSIIPLTATVYEDMDSLYIADGRALPSTSRPWSYGEAQNLFEKIDNDSLPKGFGALYESVEEFVFDTDLKFPIEDGYQLGLGGALYGEGYYHSNSDVFDLEEDWIYGYEDRAPILDLYIDIAMHDHFYTYCELEYHKALFAEEDVTEDLSDITLVQEHQASYLYKDTFSTNFFEMQYVDFETPYRAFVSAGDDGWNLQFGRDMFSWGPGQTGNFVISDNLDYYDALRFVSYHDHFKYEILYALFDDPDFTLTEHEGTSDSMNMFLAHRLEFTPLEWLSFAVSENVMYEQSLVDIKYLNPAYIFHNLNNRSMFNAIAYLEANAAVAPGFNVYLQFALDQARAPLESSSQPGAYAYMLGGTHTGAVADGVLTTNLEFAYTDPYLYQRDEVEFKVYQRHFVIGGKDYITPHVDFLGYPYGGDAIVGQLSTSYRKPGLGTFTAGLFGMLHGEIDINTNIDSTSDYDDSVGLSPSGDVVEQTIVLSTSGELELPEIEFLDVWYQIDFVNRWDYTKATKSYSDAERDLQCSFGASVSI